MIDPAHAPLAGRTIVVTRSREQASALTRRLRALGAVVIEIPAIAIVPPKSWEPLDAALRELPTYDWLVVTSANTARILGERVRLLGLKLATQPRTVAVGWATAAALGEAGFRVDLVPESAVAESLVAAIETQVRGQRVLLVRAEVARDLLPRALDAAGAEVTLVDAYRTVLSEESAALVSATFGGAAGDGGSAAPLDALTFTSSSTARNLFELLQKAGVTWPASAMVFSIGPITSGTLRELGVEPDLEATQHDVEGLVDIVLRGLGRPA
jgi:uroporphyrinogen-III synthase